MKMINNINKYKKAKKIVPDLMKSLAEIENAIDKLMPFNKYSPIQDVLQSLLDSRILIKAHLKKQKAIMDTKGAEE